MRSSQRTPDFSAPSVQERFSGIDQGILLPAIMRLDPTGEDVQMMVSSSYEGENLLFLQDTSTVEEAPLCIRELLDPNESDKWLSAARSLKNRLIGSRRQKQRLLDAHPQLIPM